LIANWTHFQSGGAYDYAGAATAQVQYLLGPQVPKTNDGAISHRVSQLQLWYVLHVRLLRRRRRKTRSAGVILFIWYPLSSHIMA
jgi:hypothetical protein